MSPHTESWLFILNMMSLPGPPASAGIFDNPRFLPSINRVHFAKLHLQTSGSYTSIFEHSHYIIYDMCILC